jgi:hypothetical protein
VAVHLVLQNFGLSTFLLRYGILLSEVRAAQHYLLVLLGVVIQVLLFLAALPLRELLIDFPRPGEGIVGDEFARLSFGLTEGHMSHVLVAHVHDVQLRYLIVLHHPESVHVARAVVGLAAERIAVPLLGGRDPARRVGVELDGLLLNVTTAKDAGLEVLVLAFFGVEIGGLERAFQVGMFLEVLPVCVAGHEHAVLPVHLVEAVLLGAGSIELARLLFSRVDVLLL